jgi:hypothetical protein
MTNRGIAKSVFAHSKHHFSEGAALFSVFIVAPRRSNFAKAEITAESP